MRLKHFMRRVVTCITNANFLPRAFKPRKALLSWSREQKTDYQFNILLHEMYCAKWYIFIANYATLLFFCFFFLRSNWSPCIRSDVTRHKKQIRLVDIFTIWRFNGCTSPFFQWPFFNLKSFFGRLDKKRIQKTCSFCNRNVCFGIRTVFLKRCLTPKMTLVLEEKNYMGERKKSGMKIRFHYTRCWNCHKSPTMFE